MAFKSVHEGQKVDNSVGAIKDGGDAGQVLTKRSGTDYDVEWRDPYIPPGTSPGDYFVFNPVAASAAAPLSMFVDSADNRLKFKDLGGNIYNILQGPLAAYSMLYTDADGEIVGADIESHPNMVPVISQDGHGFTPLGFSKDEEIVAWHIFDAGDPVQAVVGDQGFVVPTTPIGGYRLVDVIVRCVTEAAGSVVVNIFKNGITMMSQGITLTNTKWIDILGDPNAIIKPDPDCIVNRGDALSYDIQLSGDAPSGLFLSIVLRAV